MNIEKQIEKVYMVTETKHIIGEEQDMMNNETVFIYSNKEDAVNKARELNKKEGKSCIFSDEGDFEELDYDECYTNDLHYFEVVPMELNK